MNLRRMTGPLRPHAVCAVLWCWLLGAGIPLHAQSITSTLERLTRSEVSEAATAPERATDQLPYAQEKAAAAKQERDLVSSEAFRARLEAAAYPETQRSDFFRQAQAAFDNWSNAVIVLENIVAREALHGAHNAPVVAPQNSAEALAMDQELATLRERLVQLESERTSSQESLEAAHERLRLAQRNPQLPPPTAEATATPGADAVTTPSPAPILTERQELDALLARLTLDAAEAEVFYQRWSQYRQSLEETRTRERVAALEKALGDTGFHRILTSGRAQEQLAQLEKSLQSTEAEEKKAVAAFEAVSQEVSALRAKLEANPTTDATEEKHRRAELSAALALFDEHDLLRTVGRARTQFHHQAQSLWNRVLELGTHPTLVNLKNARAATEQEQAELRAASTRLERGLADARTRTDRLEVQLSARQISAAERALLQRQKKVNAQAIEQMVALKKELTQMATVQARLLEELDAEIAKATTAESFQVLMLGVWQQIQAVWNYPILEQGGRYLTLGLILTALLALVLALVTARFLARWLRHSLQARFKLVPAQADLIEKITLYLSSVLLVLMVLQWLSIPLTVFAFLGGALAVGIGFGSQNLINNFISGLILLLERKISVGDLVEVDGNFGQVTSLGSRCSGILKFDGVEVLVPNSTLLEKNVINWTLSDPHHRFDWTIGVAYGSDIDLVFSTLYEVLHNQPELLKDPAPEVAFENFGNSNLEFHVYYWVQIGSCNARQVASEMRRKIDRLFRERGLDIAYPQQDIHLKVDKALPVTIEKCSPQSS